jgi:hypothetical protein
LNEALWQPQFDDPRKILGHTPHQIGVDTFDSHAQAEDGVPNARGHILGGNSSINAGFYSGADQQFYQKSGWDLRVVNEPYEWVEKAVVFRPELRNWQSLVRADVPFLELLYRASSFGSF